MGVGDEILAEQVAYYRARAGEYDRWFRREGRYDRGAEATAAWFREVDEVVAALGRVPLDGARVLELAPGTGIWTERLAERAASVVAVDASPEMLAHCRTRLLGVSAAAAAKVTLVRADLFAWEPSEPFDAVVFCFWISHVPDDRLDAFLALVARALRPGGALFFLDGRPEPTSTAVDHRLPDADEELMTRRLDDGRSFTIVKRYRDSATLLARASAAGLEIAVRETATYFQYTVGRRPG